MTGCRAGGEPDVLTRPRPALTRSLVPFSPGLRTDSQLNLGAAQYASNGAMDTTYLIRPAAAKDMQSVLQLIDSARAWLRAEKDTNHWERPWPDRAARDARVARGIKAGLTWMVEDHQGVLAATVTYRERGSAFLWTPAELRESAVYVSRLIVSRDYAGRGIGSALIDWAGRRGAEAWQADWIRIDVWTTNTGLHEYYKEQGFIHLRTKDVADEWVYPSAALFQKPATDINIAATELFRTS